MKGQRCRGKSSVHQSWIERDRQTGDIRETSSIFYFYFYFFFSSLHVNSTRRQSRLDSDDATGKGSSIRHYIGDHRRYTCGAIGRDEMGCDVM